jgi:hypothetical protein
MRLMRKHPSRSNCLPYEPLDSHASNDAAAHEIAAAIHALFIPRFRQTAGALGRHASIVR